MPERPDSTQPQVLAPVAPTGRHRPDPLGTDPTIPWTGLVALGLVLFVVGWTDLALLWWPFGFGQPEWEFGIITGFLDGLPVATVGVSLVAIGAVARRWRRLTLGTAVFALVVVAVLVAVSVLYLLDVPLALKAAPPEMRSVLYRSLLKSGAFAVTYMAYYAWLTWFAWRHRPS
jgi:hypothetical protein